jgi:chaperonin cofactor prefoldin
MSTEPIELPHLQRAFKEMREEFRDVEVLRLQRRCQELHRQIRELQHEIRTRDPRPTQTAA